jgi:hypothetical protein
MEPQLIPQEILDNFTNTSRRLSNNIMNLPSYETLERNMDRKTIAITVGIVLAIISYMYFSSGNKKVKKKQISIIPSKYINVPPNHPTQLHQQQPQLYADKLTLTQPNMQPNPQQLQVNPENYIHSQEYPKQPHPQQPYEDNGPQHTSFSQPSLDKQPYVENNLLNAGEYNQTIEAFSGGGGSFCPVDFDKMEGINTPHE